MRRMLLSSHYAVQNTPPTSDAPQRQSATDQSLDRELQGAAVRCEQGLQSDGHVYPAQC